MPLVSAIEGLCRRHAARVIGLALFFVVCALLHPQFLTVANQRDVLDTVSINGILAVGMTLVILTAGIDLSVGSIMSLCTVVGAMLIMPTDYVADGVRLPVWLSGATLTRAQLLAIPAAALVGGLVGWWITQSDDTGPGRKVLSAVATLVCGAAAALAVLYGVRNGYATTGVLLVVPLVGCAMGLLSGVVIARSHLQPFIVTLAMMIFAVGLAKAVAGDGGRVHAVYTAAAATDTTPGTPGAPASFEQLGSMKLLKVGEETRRGVTRPVKLIPVQGLFLLGAWILAAAVLHLLPLGRHIYAVGGNEEAAHLSGIRTGRVKLFVYGVSGLLAGLAGALYCAKYMQGKADAGQMKELDAIAAVVIGGTSLMGGRGSIFGTLVGVIIFGYLTNILQLRAVSSEIQDLLKGVIIVTAALVQSGGTWPTLWRRRARLTVKPEPRSTT